MNISLRNTLPGVMAALCLATTALAEAYLSPCAIVLADGGTQAYVAAATGQKVLKVDLASGSTSQEIKLPAQLTGMLRTDSGALLVTGGGASGSLFVCDTEKGKVSRVIPLGHTPMSPLLSPDRKTLYVCNRFNNDVSFVDFESGKTRARIPVVREPVAIDITPDGRKLFVANHLPTGRADVDYVAATVSVIDTETKAVTTIPLVNGAEGLRDIKISADGKYVYATHLMARFLVPTTQLDRGWVSTDALSVIRVSDLSLQYTVLLDDVDQGFPNPWAIAFSGDGSRLLVTSAGNHELAVIDLAAMTTKVESQAATGEKSAAHLNAHNDLSFLSGIRHRVKLNGNGPRAIAVAGQTAYVVNTLSDSIDCVDLTTQRVTRTIELNPGVAMTPERQGEIFFNDAGLCFQNWLSCATCHPDARTDAMNWDLLNDGMGNPKNVKSMLHSHETPRAMWLGVRDDAETGVRAGIRYIQFAVRPEADAQAIDAYLKSLKPVPSPYLEKGKLSKSAKRGKAIFDSSSCVSCHPAPLFTDGKMYEVGTTKGQDVGRPVDTPSLVEAWRTAPYLHDGRAATMREVITTFNHANTLSVAAELSEDEINDLVEYLLSL